MASYIRRMSCEKFVLFMEEPNSEARIVEEYESIIKKQGEELHCTPEGNKEVQINGCLSYLQFLYYGPQLKNNQEIPKVSFVDGYDIKRKFLCTKNPLEEDCGTFWQTVWDNKVQIIVMMGQLTENSYQYWSPQKKNSMVFGKLKIRTQKITIHPHFILTLLILTETELKPAVVKEKRLIFHFQYTAWPKDNSPKPEEFVSFYFLVHHVYLQLRNETPIKKFTPILIHCLDGLGSSQIFCAFDIFITQFESTKTLLLSHVFEQLREQKHGSINSSDLYVVYYQIVKTYIDMMKSIIPCA